MFINEYKPEEKRSFDCVDGDHRVKIVKVENTTAKSGLRMIQLALQVEGVPLPYIHFICEGDRFNYSMTRVFDAFKIARGNFQFGTWLNKIGYAHFEHREDTYTDEAGVQHNTNRARLIFFHNTVPGQQAEGVPQNVQALQQAVGGSVQSAEIFPDDIPF